MALSVNDANYLKQRKQWHKTWRSIGPVLVAGLVIFYGFLLLAAPMLLNPFAVMNRLQDGTVDITTLQTMAIMLPVILTLLCLLVLALLGFVYQSLRTESRYHAMLESLASVS